MLPMSSASDPIAEFIPRLEAIESGLPDSDGIWRFNHLYLEITRAIDVAVQTPGFFEEPAFLDLLAPRFSGIYFAAVDANNAGKPTSRCWAPLFAVRSDTRISPVQFALAGMNAHINHDLALALVAASEAAGTDLSRDSPHFRDHTKVNQVLMAVWARVKQEYLTGMVGLADHVLGHIDTVAATWSVEEARDAAWTQAQMLWELRQHRDLTAAFEYALDGSVGLASRGLLIPPPG
jgi:hypothetical protein